MSDLGIGKLVAGSAGKDAIHIAIAPMTATMELAPGQHVGIVDSQRAGVTEVPIGIVDPYLTAKVRPGERFYMFLYPNTVTSLRHEWVHPSFVGAVFMEDSVAHKWIEEFAAELDQTYNRLMEAATTWIQSNDYTYDNSERYKRVPVNRWEEFWDHYETVTSTKVVDKKATFFTCSC